jgi:hypothetical protein
MTGSKYIRIHVYKMRIVYAFETEAAGGSEIPRRRFFSGIRDQGSVSGEW